jgi:hypothetical protein
MSYIIPYRWWGHFDANFMEKGNPQLSGTERSDTHPGETMGLKWS